jgi:hypothetical protein
MYGNIYHGHKSVPVAFSTLMGKLTIGIDMRCEMKQRGSLT